MGYKGYIFSREFMGERAPQHIQNIVIRNYCETRSLMYLLSATEYAMSDCFLILKRVIDELDCLEGIVAYSLFQMPADDALRKMIFSKFVSTSKTLHFAVEGITIQDNISLERAENIWQVRKTLPNCITRLSDG